MADEERLKFLKDWEEVLDSDETHVLRVLEYMVQTKWIGMEGAGWIRLIVGPGPTVEYCYLCGCRKSGWANMENAIDTRCEYPVCLCHTAEWIR